MCTRHSSSATVSSICDTENKEEFKEETKERWLKIFDDLFEPSEGFLENDHEVIIDRMLLEATQSRLHATRMANKHL